MDCAARGGRRILLEQRPGNDGRGGPIAVYVEATALVGLIAFQPRAVSDGHGATRIDRPASRGRRVVLKEGARPVFPASLLHGQSAGQNAQGPAVGGLVREEGRIIHVHAGLVGEDGPAQRSLVAFHEAAVRKVQGAAPLKIDGPAVAPHGGVVCEGGTCDVPRAFEEHGPAVGL